MGQNLNVEKLLNFLFWEDILILLFGIYIGAFIVIFLVCILDKKTKTIDSKHFKKLTFVSLVDNGGEKNFFINKTRGNSTFEAMRALLLMMSSLLFTPKDYVVRSEKKAKAIAKILIIIFVIVSVLALVAIVNRLPFIFKIISNPSMLGCL